MAVDKKGIAAFLRSGQTPAAGLLPPLEGYEGPASLVVDVGGIQYDVLSHDPNAARRLLDEAGLRHLRIDILYPALPSSQDIPQILQQQWRSQLDAEVVLHNQELSVCIQNRNTLQYNGVAERGWWADYLDPNTFLEAFLSGPSVIGAGWSDVKFDLMLSAANAAPTVAKRMSMLADCEKYLLRAMPVLPLYYNVQTVLKKPYVRGLPAPKVDSIRFKYAWIDTDWKPS
jgi:oligopeptide transport system substrate-binding protein